MRLCLALGDVVLFELAVLESVDAPDEDEEPDDVHSLSSTTDIAEPHPIGFGYVEPEERAR